MFGFFLILTTLIFVATFVFTHRINIEWKGLSENICRKSKNDLIKRIPASAVGGQRNCIKHIWGMEPIWLMDVGYDIVLEDSAVRPSDATAAQASTNHYRLIIEHSWSGPWGGRRGGRHARENKGDEHSVNDDYGHLGHTSPSWQKGWMWRLDKCLPPQLLTKSRINPSSCYTRRSSWISRLTMWCKNVMTQHATESRPNACSLLKLMGPGKQGHIGPVGRSLSECGMSSKSAAKVEREWNAGPDVQEKLSVKLKVTLLSVF